jgi:hypothetical protein
MTTITRFPCPHPVQDADEDGIYTTDCEAPAATYADGTGWACVNGHHDADDSYRVEDPAENFRERYIERMYATA